jgi:hypothetical protein
MTETEVVFKDFTKAKKRVEFKIDDDTFVAPKVLPIPVMQELAQAADALKANESTSDALNKIINVFDIILLTDSATKMRERVASKDEPVDLGQLSDILLWLLEVYGLRPTQQSSSLSAGSPDGTSGTPLTAGAPSVG